MSILPVYSCFNPIMREESLPVEKITPEIITLARDMLATMHNADGVGLAGNQVGSKLSIVVLDTSLFDDCKNPYKDLILINPVITASSDENSDFSEGCLSIPTINEPVSRPKGVTVNFTDITGTQRTIEDDDYFARVAQHEIDHLHGRLFIDLISPMRRTLIKSKLRKLQRGTLLPKYDFVDKNGIIH